MALKNTISREPVRKAQEPGASWMERLLSWVFVREDIPTRDGVSSLYNRRFHLFSYRCFRESVWGRASRWPRLKWLLAHLPQLYLHCFYRSDDDPDPHDHPWDFFSLVLWGGYIDEVWRGFDGTGPLGAVGRVPVGSIRRGTGALCFRRAEHIHRAHLMNHNRRTWTLILRMPKRRPWFFWTDAGPVHWEVYLRDKRGQEGPPIP